MENDLSRGNNHQSTWLSPNQYGKNQPIRSTSSTSVTISATTPPPPTVVVSTPQPAFLPPLTNGCNSCVGLGAVPLSTYSECVASNPMVTAQIIAKDSGCGMDAYGIHYTLYSAAGVD